MKFFLKILLISCNLNLILCSCKLSVLNLCETLADLNIHGDKTWQYVAISPDLVYQHDDNKELSNQLERSTFAATPNLEQVYIGETLNSIDGYAFSSMTNLKFIKLWKNVLTVIQRNTFSDLPNLRKIDLQENGIENMQHYSFANSSVKELDLRNNKLTNIQVEMLNLKSLHKISLSGNKLTVLVDGCFGVNVQHLDLSKNLISTLSVGVLDKLHQLKHLNLSGNTLMSITEDFGKVTALRNVKVLDLSYNIIQIIEKNALAQLLSLQSLYLNDNKIQFLSSNGFPSATNLKILFLHRNSLGGLDPDLANKMLNLEKITLGGNPWVCVYWQTIERHLASVRPKCDIDVTSGENPVCVANESLISEAATFHKFYSCEYDTQC